MLRFPSRRWFIIYGLNGFGDKFNFDFVLGDSAVGAGVTTTGVISDGDVSARYASKSVTVFGSAKLYEFRLNLMGREISVDSSTTGWS